MMKKFYISALLLSVFGFYHSVAQAEWRMGVAGGATYNRYVIDTQYQTDYRYGGAFGWTAAVFGQYNFMDWLGLRAELEATERNYRFRRTGIWAGTDYVTRNTYLQLPVLVQFSFGGQKVRGFVNTGLYGAYWLVGQYQGTVSDIINGKTVTIDEPYIFHTAKDRRWDLGLSGGIGVEYRFLEHWATYIEARCYYSLISTTKQYMVIKDYRYNSTVSMSLGFTYIY